MLALTAPPLLYIVKGILSACKMQFAKVIYTFMNDANTRNRLCIVLEMMTAGRHAEE